MAARRRVVIKRPRVLTKARVAFETRTKNVLFQRAVQQAQDRTNMKMERNRLHGLLHTSLPPGLREKTMSSGRALTDILGD